MTFCHSYHKHTRKHISRCSSSPSSGGYRCQPPQSWNSEKQQDSNVTAEMLHSGEMGICTGFSFTLKIRAIQTAVIQHGVLNCVQLSCTGSTIWMLELCRLWTSLKTVNSWVWWWYEWRKKISDTLLSLEYVSAAEHLTSHFLNPLSHGGEEAINQNGWGFCACWWCTQVFLHYFSSDSWGGWATYHLQICTNRFESTSVSVCFSRQAP